VELDKGDDPVPLDDEAYPVNLHELWFPGQVGVVNLTGLLWWEGGCLSVILCW